jgi:glycosyltransferase involved in cell wall biosynthesis
MIGMLPILDGRGTEYMTSSVAQKFFYKLDNLQKYNWVVLPTMTDQDVELTRQNETIVWIHVPTLYAPMSILQFFYDESLTSNIKAYVVQSEFHKKDIVENFDVDPSKVFILNNAFDPIEYVKKDTEHVSLIYTPQASRGLDILLDAFVKIKDSNISLTIHGCSCNECMVLFEHTEYVKGLADSRIDFVGHTNRNVYVRNLQQSNLMVYPCKFEETAGIGIMEALSAGIKIVCTDLGALSETTMGFAKIVKGYPREIYKQRIKRKKYVRVFRKEIKKAIREIRKNKFDPTLQVKAINERFSWEAIEKQWIDFNSSM